jgi:hypothetical protein
MKSAFAKLMVKNPVQTSETAFRAGGDGVPILTRASGQSTAGYQTMGLPTNNKTVLGSIRMGDDDGNGPASAIVGGVGEIFFPFRAPDRVYPERFFSNVGNNVFQPENNDNATHALLRRLGDQKFKAEANAPFEEYRALQRQAKDLEEASRNAALSDLGTSREIIRNIAEQRRQQNEDDYLRKMLDAGATPESARKEIEDVRNANAIQEAKKVDDRQYQAKTLIQRMAMARGVTPMVQEPLNQSSSIDNPQRSQAMSQAMGMPGEGFGTSPLDMNRQFMTPEFYKKFLRKTNLSQESADEQSAFNRQLAEGEIPLPSTGAYSFATMKSQERQQQVEMASEALAARLESLRARGNRILSPLPDNIIFKKILNKLYDNKKVKKGNKVLTSLETIQDMNPLQLMIAMNLTVINGGVKAFERLQQAVRLQDFGTLQNPTSDLINKLRIVALRVNRNESNISIPLASSNLSMNTRDFLSQFYEAIDDIKTGKVSTINQEIQKARNDLAKEGDISGIPAPAFTPAPAPGSRRGTRRNRGRGAGAGSGGGGAGQPGQLDEEPVPGAPGR